jgi:hypothetical protein
MIPGRRIGWVVGLALLGAAAIAGPAGAEQILAVYDAFWAGLPAGRIRLALADGNSAYRDEIEIRAEGLPYLVTRFRGTARAAGRLGEGPAEPAHYDAVYDLHKRRNSRIAMRFVAHGGVTVAERGPGDTGHKPPLGEQYRRNVVDPMTALERLRGALRQALDAGRPDFAIPVYDGARRFDVLGHVLPKSAALAGTLRVALTLRPIAGFKGETSDDGDPDDAARPVDLVVTDDWRLVPLSIRVSVFYLPLVVRLDHLCTERRPCPG